MGIVEAVFCFVVDHRTMTSVFVVVIGICVSLCAGIHALMDGNAKIMSIEMVDYINNGDFGWKAKVYEEFSDLTIINAAKLLGFKEDPAVRKFYSSKSPKTDTVTATDLPTEFDSRQRKY